MKEGGWKRGSEGGRVEERGGKGEWGTNVPGQL